MMNIKTQKVILITYVLSQQHTGRIFTTISKRIQSPGEKKKKNLNN